MEGGPLVVNCRPALAATTRVDSESTGLWMVERCQAEMDVCAVVAGRVVELKNRVWDASSSSSPSS